MNPCALLVKKRATRRWFSVERFSAQGAARARISRAGWCAGIKKARQSRPSGSSPACGRAALSSRQARSPAPAKALPAGETAQAQGWLRRGGCAWQIPAISALHRRPSGLPAQFRGHYGQWQGVSGPPGAGLACARCHKFRVRPIRKRWARYRQGLSCARKRSRSGAAP